MKKHLRLIGIALAGAFALTACGAAKLTGITLPDAPIEIATGETTALNISYTYDKETPEDAQPEVSYTSSDESIATVDSDGIVSGMGEGEVTITATAEGLSATQNVIVSIPVTSLAITEDLSLHITDEPTVLPYVVVPSHFSGELTFASSDSSIAAVDRNGQVTPVSAGEATVTITAPNGLTATAAVEIWDGSKEITLTAGKTEITKGGGTQIIVTDEQGNEIEAECLTWKSSDESIAAVSTGWVDMIGTGDVTITADAGHGVSATVNLTGVAPTPKPSSNAGSASSGTSSGSAGAGSSVGGGAAPATNAGHGTFTIYGDGTAFDLQNSVRAGAGVGALTWDNGLGDIAAARCQQIALDFSHNGAQTSENIAWGPADSATAISAWQNSPGHYANMVNAGFTRGAIAHMYDSDGCHFWVSVFQ